MLFILITEATDAPPIASTITASDSHVGTSGTQWTPSPPLMNGKVLPCRASMMSLTPMKTEHHGQAGRQVDELVEQSTQQEVQLLQAEQCEHVGGEHQERILGQAEDRGNRVGKRT